MKNKTNIAYWIFTGLFCAFMLFSGVMSILDQEHATAEFQKLGFPAYIVYPLGVAKILGVIAILQPKVTALKEWAYAAFFFELLLAFSAHFVQKDGEQTGALVAIVLLLTSYYFYKKQ